MVRVCSLLIMLLVCTVSNGQSPDSNTFDHIHDDYALATWSVNRINNDYYSVSRVQHVVAEYPAWNNTAQFRIQTEDGEFQTNWNTTLYSIRAYASNPPVTMQVKVSLKSGTDAYAYIDLFPVVAPTKEIRLSLQNTSDFPIEYKVYQGDELLGTKIVEPHTGYIEQFTVLDNDEEITVERKATGYSMEGNSWVREEGAVTDLGSEGLGTGGSFPDADSGEDPTPVPLPDNIPDDQQDNSDPLWEPEPEGEESDGLTESVYKQGVDILSGGLDRIKETLENEADLSDWDAVEITELTEEEDFDVVRVTDEITTVQSLAESIETGLVINGPSVTPYQISFTFDVPNIGSRKVEVNLSKYSSEITIFRNICKAVLTIFFFLIMLKAFREGFA